MDDPACCRIMAVRSARPRRSTAGPHRLVAAKWQGKYPKLTSPRRPPGRRPLQESDRWPAGHRWVEENIEETLTFYRLPRQHHKHLKSTNMLERLHEEIKRRTHVVRNLPQCRELPAAGTGIGGRDARELARAAPLPKHGGPARTQEGTASGWPPDRLVDNAPRSPQGPPHQPPRPNCRALRTQLREGGGSSVSSAAHSAAVRSAG